MEYSKSSLDFILWPRAWHKRLNSVAMTLVPGLVVVGFFVILTSPRSILNDFILTGGSGAFMKVLLFAVIAALIGFIDVICFAWPIADLCRYLARRSEKFIIPGFNIIFMKSYAYSHFIFLPLIFVVNPMGLQLENLGPATPFFSRVLIILMTVLISTQVFWQMAIMLRTVSVKSKLELPGKLVVAAAIILWGSLHTLAIRYLIDVGYQAFAALDKIT